MSSGNGNNGQELAKKGSPASATSDSYGHPLQTPSVAVEGFWMMEHLFPYKETVHFPFSRVNLHCAPFFNLTVQLPINTREHVPKRTAYTLRQNFRCVESIFLGFVHVEILWNVNNSLGQRIFCSANGSLTVHIALLRHAYSGASTAVWCSSREYVNMNDVMERLLGRPVWLNMKWTSWSEIRNHSCLHKRELTAQQRQHQKIYILPPIFTDMHCPLNNLFMLVSLGSLLWYWDMSN